MLQFQRIILLVMKHTAGLKKIKSDCKKMRKVRKLIVSGRGTAIFFDGRALRFFRPALFFLGAGNFCFSAFLRHKKGCRHQIFEADSRQFPVPGEAAGLFGNNHDSAGGMSKEKSRPDFLRKRGGIYKIEGKPDPAACLVDMLSAGSGCGSDKNLLQIIVPEVSHCVAPVPVPDHFFCPAPVCLWGHAVFSLGFPFLPFHPGRFSFRAGSR